MLAAPRMTRRHGATAAALMLAVAGGGCDGFSLGGVFETVTVELVNLTDFPVDPELYADDDERTFFEFNIRTDENFVDVGIVPANSTVRVSLSCDDAGTMMVYNARQILPGSDWYSDNDPIIYEDGDFDCHDIVSFVFRESAFDFWTEVEVNGRVIID